MSEPFSVASRLKPLDRGKVLTVKKTSNAWADLPLSRCRRRCDWLAYAARHGSSQGCLLHARPPATTTPRGTPELPHEYVEVMERFVAQVRKFARKHLPAPVAVKNGTSKIGFLAYGSTDFALRESLDQIKNDYKLDVDYLRIRAFPISRTRFTTSVASHERVYVVEQDRDAQLARPAQARSSRRPGGQAAQHFFTTTVCPWMPAASRTSLRPRRASNGNRNTYTQNQSHRPSHP